MQQELKVNKNKISIFYNSRFGNGKIVGEYLCEVLTKANLKTNCFSIAKLDPKKIEESNLYIFSSSTHLGNAPFKTRRFLSRLRIHHGNYLIVTTNIEPKKAKTIKTMQKILNEKGLKELCPPLSLKVKTLKGPLEKTYKNKLEQWVKIIKSALTNNL